MALFLLSRKGHHSRLITPATQSNVHNCAQLKINSQKLQTNNCTKSSSDNYYLFNDASSSIQFENYQTCSGHQIVKSATVLQLVEHLTSPRQIQPEFTNAFFLTFRSFCSPPNLLDLLIRRFQVLTPLKLQATANDNLYGYFRDRHKRPIQKRVLQIIHFWICNQIHDFVSDSALVNKLEKFLDGKLVSFNVLQRIWSAKIKHTLKQKLLVAQNEEKDAIFEIQAMMAKRRRRHRLQSKFSTYLYLNTKNGFINSETFWQLKASKIAKQLTLIHFHFYQSIQSMEFLNWTGPNKNIDSPHLVRMVEFSTTFSDFIAHSIVEQASVWKRVAIISKVLEVMQECLNLKNYSAFVQLYSALNQTAVFRLTRTKSLLSPESKQLMQSFQSLIDPHWKRMSRLVRTCSSHCIPFIGVYLSQLVFLDNGQSTILEKNTDFKNQLVCFRKCRKIALVVKEIQQFQHHPYCFKIDTGILRFILSVNPERGFNNRAHFETYLYEKSLSIESTKQKKC